MDMKRSGSVLLLLVSLGLLFQGGWIHAKAKLAQYLIESAWARAVEEGRAVKPWPWADTHPVARLQVPRLGIEQFVLEGASGRVLAFGPGHISGTALPGSGGNSVISGHRDTHFNWLKDLLPGDELVLETPDSRTTRYRMARTQIISGQDNSILQPTSEPRLQLLTCYPFDAIIPGTKKRYLVTAMENNTVTTQQD